MKVINDNTGCGKEGILIEKIEELGIMLYLRDLVLNILKEEKNPGEEIKNRFKRSKKGDYSEMNKGIFVIPSKFIKEFKEQYDDEV